MDSQDKLDIQISESTNSKCSNENDFLTTKKNLNILKELEDDSKENEFSHSNVEANEDFDRFSNEREADLAMYEYVHNMTTEDFKPSNYAFPHIAIKEPDPEPVIEESYPLSDSSPIDDEINQPDIKDGIIASEEVEIDENPDIDTHGIAQKEEVIHTSNTASVMVKNESNTENSAPNKYSWRYCEVKNCNKAYETTSRGNGNFRFHVLSHYYIKMDASILRKHGIKTPKHKKRLSCLLSIQRM